jgi:hypothetical protein
MGGKLHSEVRYRLRPGALAWLVARNPAWTRPDGMQPNIERIAAAARINPATLLKTVSGLHEPSSRLMASLVVASGAQREEAEREMFEIVGTAEVEEPELAGAAA